MPPNTTSKIQPLDAGIIANFKALFRKELIRFTLNQIESGLDTKIEVRKSLIWAAGAWADVTKITIVNCWEKVGLLPDQGQTLCPDPQRALAELEKMLVNLAEVTGDAQCRVEDCGIDGEQIIQNPDVESEDEEDEEEDMEMLGGASGVELEDTGAVENTSRTITLQKAREAAMDVFNFLLDNQDQAPCNPVSEKA